MTGSEMSLYWLIGGAALIAAELIVPGGIVLFLGLGAILVAALSYLGFIEGWLVAGTTWFVVSLGLVFGLRSFALRFMGAQVERGQTDEDLDAYNQTATVVELIPADGEGRIQFRGSTWPARNYHADRDLPAGSRVRIVLRDNLVWVVEASEN